MNCLELVGRFETRGTRRADYWIEGVTPWLPPADAYCLGYFGGEWLVDYNDHGRVDVLARFGQDEDAACAWLWNKVTEPPPKAYKLTRQEEERARELHRLRAEEYNARMIAKGVDSRMPTDTPRRRRHGMMFGRPR